MAPRRQPFSLFKLCIIKCIKLVNYACYIIKEKYPEDKFDECVREAFSLKCYLMSMFPARLLEVLCSQRICCNFHGDSRLQLLILTHPKMTVFCKNEVDNSIPEQFWLETLPTFKHLVLLDLKFICTDEILHVVGDNCLLLQELNIVSRVDIYKSQFNASVLLRYVSDAGLCSIAKLKHLRILAMDPPRNERANRVGRCVSQVGLIMLIIELPLLEELRIETCDIGSTLISTVMDIEPLNLRKINCHFASAEGIKKLIKLCPNLRELSVTRLTEYNKDGILQEIFMSDLCLNKLDLSFFPYTDSIKQLLVVKGKYLTHFSFRDFEHTINFDVILSIGVCCPNLNSLNIITQSRTLIIPQDFHYPKKMFSQLRSLTIGNDNFNIHNMLTFFLNCTQHNLQKLVLQYQTRINISETLSQMLQKGYLKNLNYLWLDCTLDVSKNVILTVIQFCEKLQSFTVELGVNMNDVHVYIHNNNFDINIGNY